ncbi:MAG: GGDEF domain-containing protein [Gammaproteobacteria bacterium]|nr:GGDEF domain-containing protein [Gammaproteobacteria bacterium]MBU1415469.1 GGDEF domain-containing protein [Gammaproteobacteria bacterium]
MRAVLLRLMTPGTVGEPWALALAIVASAAIFIGNLAVPPVFSLRILYLLPLAILAIHVSRRAVLVSGNLVVLAGVVHSIAILDIPEHYCLVQCVLAIAAFLMVSYILRIGRQRFMALREVATHDPLTGLNTRAIFRDALEKEIFRQRRYHGTFSLAIIDLDYFKQLNDTRGHDDGDVALQIVARTMEQYTRAADTLGRIGGDEFALLMPSTNQEDCDRVCNLLAERIALAMRKAGYAVSASVGGVTFEHAPVSSIEAMRAADTAMYQAKARGRGCSVTVCIAPLMRESQPL